VSAKWRAIDQEFREVGRRQRHQRRGWQTAALVRLSAGCVLPTTAHPAEMVRVR
jgi:hypothetical protein